MTLESRVRKIEQEAERQEAVAWATKTGVSVDEALEGLRQAKAIQKLCPDCEARSVSKGAELVDIEPCVRCYAQKMGVDPDAAVEEARRITEDKNQGEAHT